VQDEPLGGGLETAVLLARHQGQRRDLGEAGQARSRWTSGASATACAANACWWVRRKPETPVPAALLLRLVGLLVAEEAFGALPIDPLYS
jgi:hypothetical protein